MLYALNNVKYLIYKQFSRTMLVKFCKLDMEEWNRCTFLIYKSILCFSCSRTIASFIKPYWMECRLLHDLTVQRCLSKAPGEPKTVWQERQLCLLCSSFTCVFNSKLYSKCLWQYWQENILKWLKFKKLVLFINFFINNYLLKTKRIPRVGFEPMWTFVHQFLTLTP